MKDVECPYCKAALYINHDDGYGLEEDETHEQECSDCDKIFVYTTWISFSYEASKADCLNGGEHKWGELVISPRNWPDARRCTDCGLEERGEFKED